MHMFFIVNLFNFSITFIDLQPCLADEPGFYEQIRKLKNPSDVQIDEIRSKTLDQNRRNSANEISKSNQLRNQDVKKESLADKENKRDDDNDNGKANKKDMADPGVKLVEEEKTSPQKQTPQAPAPSTTQSDKTITVNPGNLDELVFPGSKKKKKN